MKSLKSNRFLYCIILFIGISYISLNAITIKKVSELKFDYEVAFFLVGDELVVWDSSNFQLLVYRDNSLVKTVKLGKGQGPGDVQILNNVITTPEKYAIWDRPQRRFSYFDKDWKFEKIEKLNVSGYASPIAVEKDRFIFKWSDMERNAKGVAVTQTAGIIKRNGEKYPLKQYKEPLNDRGSMNFDRSILLSEYSNGILYYSNNREYKIYSLDLKKSNQAPQLYIQRNVKSENWKTELGEMKYEIIKKPKELPKVIYPDHIPLIFDFFVDNDIIGVVTFEGISKKRSTIDFFIKGKYIGTTDIPLIQSQYFIFPSEFYFGSGIGMHKNFLYALVYDFEGEVFKIIKWKVQL